MSEDTDDSAQAQPCKYCRRPFEADAEARRQNPYCSGCLTERLETAAAANPVDRWDRRGKYAFPVREGDPS